MKCPFNRLEAIPFYQVHLTDGFWAERQRINREISIFHQYEQLEKDHHIDNFKVAAGLKQGTHQGEFYYDSDLYKWLEAACYILHIHEDKELEDKVNEIIDLVVKSQMKDSYVNTFYSTKFLHKRFTNLQNMHELYCAGHLIQAAIAHYEATGIKILLNVAKKFADLLVNIFLGNKRKGAPGHEEIEIALIQLYKITKKDNYLELAEDFINRRGNISSYRTYALNQFFDMISTLSLAKKINENFKVKNKNLKINEQQTSEVAEWFSGLWLRDWVLSIKETLNGKIFQLNIPVRKAYEPVGHAVRALYLYCGISDLYSEKGEKTLLKALKRIWSKMVKTRMYITGGVGSVKATEGFGKDFFLNPKNSYSETCAAIGNMMWNWRMLQITGNCKYADLIEKLLYNAILVGQSIDGKKYSYSNALISIGEERRKQWFKCPCCPPNMARIIASIGQYIYSISAKGVWIHQYVNSRARLNIDKDTELFITQESKFPWSGDLKINLNLNKSKRFSIFLRIPIWTGETELFINQEKYQEVVIPGKYMEIIRNWSNNDTIELRFKMQPKLEKSDERVKQTRKKVAISYGPLIYCLEQRDNKEIDIFKAEISKSPELKVSFKPKLLKGVNIIQGKLTSNQIFSAIPYYAWGNRGKNKMLVWIKVEREEIFS
jgi:DUF1680 family protein